MAIASFPYTECMAFLDGFIGIIAPHICVGCSSEGAVLCLQCAQQVQTTPPRCYHCAQASKTWQTCSAWRYKGGIHNLYVWGSYTDVLKLSIHALKYERAMAAANDLIQGMPDMLTHLPTGIVIVPAPTTPARIRQRGYDQSELLARALAKKLGLPVLHMLQRKGSQHQVGSTALQRRTQLTGVFEAIQKPPRHVLLVDDVLTTGATLEEAARTLREAGAKQVQAVVIAQA